MKKNLIFVWSSILIVIPISVFSPTFFNDFQRSWDDQWMLLEHPYILNFSWTDLVYHFGSFYHGQYSPVNTVFYLTINSLFGFNAAAFHTACLLIHIVNVLLVFFVTRIIIEKIKPRWYEPRILVYAGVVSLLFAIHPLQVESVAWISASKVVLYALFCLMGSLSYLRYLKTTKISWYLSVLLCYLLAFGTKEQAIIFPLNLILLDWVFGRYRSVPFNWRLITKDVFVEKLPFFLLAAGMWYFSVQNNLGNLDTAGAYPFHQRLVFGAHSLVQYIFRFLAPVRLYYWYFYPMTVGGELPFSYWAYPLLAGIVLLFVWSLWRDRNHLPVFGFAFFTVNLVLALHIIPMPRATITADRYMYLSIPGLALACIWLIDYLYLKFRGARKGVLLAGCMLFVAFGIQSFTRTVDWRNSEALRRNIQEIVEKRKKEQQAVANNPLEDVPKQEGVIQKKGGMEK